MAILFYQLPSEKVSIELTRGDGSDTLELTLKAQTPEELRQCLAEAMRELAIIKGIIQSSDILIRQ